MELLLALNMFVSDGCTMFPEGTRNQPNLWAHCCMEHDLFYWAGGSKFQQHSADLQLRDCIRATGKTFIAELVYKSVRLGHWSPIKFRSQLWGNAWHDRPKFRSLSAEELEQVTIEMESYDLPLELKLKLLDSLSLL